MRGDKTVSIFGRPYTVRCDLRRIDSLSGHGDYSEMMRYISCQNQRKLKKIFLVHGEEQTQQNFRQRLLDAGYKDVEVPTFREAVEIS